MKLLGKYFDTFIVFVESKQEKHINFLNFGFISFNESINLFLNRIQAWFTRWIFDLRWVVLK